MYTFHRVTAGREHLARRIQSALRERHAMHIDELRMRLGTEGSSIQAELEEMVARGEVERLRPLGYAGEDHDFFRVNRPATVSREARDKREWQAVQTGRDHVRLAVKPWACLPD